MPNKSLEKIHANCLFGIDGSDDMGESTEYGGGGCGGPGNAVVDGNLLNVEPKKDPGPQTQFQSLQDSKESAGSQVESDRQLPDLRDPLDSCEDNEGALGFRNIEPVNASVRGLVVEVGPTITDTLLKRATSLFQRKNDAGREPTTTTILNDINVDVPAGTLCAIIGGSGSGKTSLLNVMAQRMVSSNLALSGSVTYNGQPQINRVRNAYVLQEDILQPNLTCIETLRYAAELRLPNGVPKQEREALVSNIILELGLKDCANTMVGDSMHKGLSGGEKRRLSIGIQLLANPSLLFLDEPTTGLDAHSAYLLVQTCRRLAHKGRTLVMSIHQPRSDIFFLFDSIVLLSRGHCVYSGPVKGIVGHFENLGYPFPEHINPADYIVDLSAVDTRTSEQEEESSRRVKSLMDSWKQIEAQALALGVTEAVQDAADPGKSTPIGTRAPFWRQVWVQARRTLVVSKRDPLGYVGLLVECAAMGTICGWVFFKPGGSLSGIRSTMGLLYTACAAQGYLILVYETYRLCRSDLKVFDREHNEGCLGPSSFLLARRLAKVFTEDLYVPLIFSAIVYFMAGLRTDSARHFFIFFANTLLQHHIAVSYATVCSGISRDFTNAALVANLGYTLQSMACGFFVNAANMPVYVRWTRWIAYVYYGFGTLISNQFNGYMGDCPYAYSSEECYPYSGAYVLDTLGFPHDWILVPICVNVAWAVGFWLTSYILLKFVRVNIVISKKQATREVKETARATSNMDGYRARINVSLSDLRLQVEKRSPLTPRKRITPILNGISANFIPGSVNAILGPSGSGKSSLLNFMADRLNSSFSQHYKSSGGMLFNGMVPTKTLSRSLVSYVTQEDDGLMPALTVRETLYFAAELRLPRVMSSAEKRRRADDVILQMGLRDCADTLIGDEFVKGISGGEKRRVTISVQLLSDPKIMLLDEPTSGLDAFTAGSILQVLKALADDGRTVICTIHQPRSDLFAQFGNVLLLSKGGRVAYNGPCANMIEYFSELGYSCPPLTNPADHFLDLISVNLQSEEKEVSSKLRVSRIIGAWKSVYENTKLHSEGMNENESGAQDLSTLQTLVRTSANFFVAYPILLRRNVLNFSRSPHMIVARIMQVVGIGIVFCLFFAPLADDYIGIINRLGFVQEITALYFVGMLNNMAIYPSDRAVFYRDHDDRLYGVSAFFAVYLTLELPFEVITALIFSVFMVIIPGLNRSVNMYFATAYCVLAIVNCGESIGIIFNTLFRHEGFAVNLISVVLSIGSFMAGIMSLNMPGFLKGVNWLSPLKYAVSIVINLAFQNQVFSCRGQVTDAQGGCAFDTGEKVLESYGLESDVHVYFAAMTVAIVLYRLLAYSILKLMRLQRGIKSK